MISIVIQQWVGLAFVIASLIIGICFFWSMIRRLI